jgi:signal transduction histidine kinase
MARSRRLDNRNKSKKTATSEIEQMAAFCVQTRAALVQAGRVLHDHVGSSLSAAGMQLQLLRMDVPAVQVQVDKTLGILEEALNQVRDLSQELCPSPAYRGGLKQALLRLADQHASGGCHVDVDYNATAVIPVEIAAALYEAGAAAVEQARQKGAARVSITVRGARKLVLRISDDGRKSGRIRAFSAIRTLSRAQGLVFDCATGKSTIVCIQYAIRRTPRG